MNDKTKIEPKARRTISTMALQRAVAMTVRSPKWASFMLRLEAHGCAGACGASHRRPVHPGADRLAESYSPQP